VQNCDLFAAVEVVVTIVSLAVELEAFLFVLAVCIDGVGSLSLHLAAAWFCLQSCTRSLTTRSSLIHLKTVSPAVLKVKKYCACHHSKVARFWYTDIYVGILTQ